MDGESPELRTCSQSWPPGFFVGSVVLDGSVRARRRDGLMMIALAACGWCAGYVITNWVCDANQRLLTAARAQHVELDAVESRRARAERSQSARAAAARAGAAGAELAVRTEVAGLVPAQSLPLATAATARSVPPASKRARTAASARRAPEPQTQTLDCPEEPSSVVSPETLDRALPLAAASKTVFASVEEGAPAAQPSAAAMPDAARAAANIAKVVEIESLHVEGGVPSRVVNRGVQRLLPQYDRCREFCDSAPQRMKLSTTIDEAGRGRQVTVEGLSRPALRRCLEQATSHLVVPAPDTGTARARWTVRFASR